MCFVENALIIVYFAPIIKKRDKKEVAGKKLIQLQSNKYDAYILKLSHLIYDWKLLISI